jgi:glycosyltransferase involved in cell wall biosynthesis
MAEFLVFISRYEGFGFPIIEALSQGTPVITTRLSSLPEVAGPGALYVDPDNLGGIAFAMKTLLSNRMKRNALAKAGKSHIRRFASDQAASRTLKLYGELLGGIPDA